MRVVLLNKLCNAIGDEMDRAVEAGGIDAVTAALRGADDTSDRELLEAGCALLGRFLIADFELTEQAGERGIVAALVSALRHTGGGEGGQRVVISICESIEHTCEMFDDNAAAACAAGAAEAMVVALRDHCAGSTEALAHCCNALLSTWLNEELEGVAGASGILEATIAMLGANIDSAEVQRAGCQVLASANAGNQVRAGGAGGIEAVVAAMKAHRGAEAVQLVGCNAFKHLLCGDGNAENRTRARAAGAAAELEAAAAAFPTGRVTEFAKAALEALASSRNAPTAEKGGEAQKLLPHDDATAHRRRLGHHADIPHSSYYYTTPG